MSLSSMAKPLVRRAARQFTRHGRIGYPLSVLRKLGGVHPRTCTICSFEGRFRAFGDPPRWDAQCPSCGSLERHRLLALMLNQRHGLVEGRVIHFAPEPAIRDLVRPHASQYQSADLFMRGCDLALDLEKLNLEDESVDVFIASHVLEHVDDAKALSELHRCLKQDGVAIIMVPIVEGWSQTYENSAIQSDAERTLHFGQFDHVRYYGSDLRDRIRAARFDLQEFSASPQECIKFGLMPGEIIFLARRRS